MRGCAARRNPLNASHELGFYLYKRPALIKRDAHEHLPDVKGRCSA